MKELFKHQADILANHGMKSGFGLWLEMGTGKSRVVIENAKLLYDEDKIEAVVIIATASVYLNWLRQYAEWQPEVVPMVYSSANPKKSQILIAEGIAKSGLKVLLINVESLSKSTGVAVKTLVSFLGKFNKEVLMVIDESNIIGNPKSKRTEVILTLRKYVNYRRVLSGTPGVETPLKLWSQLEFIAPGCTNMSFFAYSNYVGIYTQAYMGNRTYKQLTGYRRIDWVKKLMLEHGQFISKSECLDLPPKLYETRTVILEPEHRKAYNEFTKTKMLEVSTGRLMPDNAMEMLYQLHNLTTGWAKTEFGVTWLSEHRITVLLEVLEEIPADRKVIIYSPSRVELEALSVILGDTYGPQGISRFHGGMEIRARNREVDKFQKESDCRIFLANQSIAGFGLNLAAASYIIYFRNAYSLDVRMQSEDRAHRQGQVNPVTIIDLVAKGTADEHVIDALYNKQDIASQIIPFVKKVFSSASTLFNNDVV